MPGMVIILLVLPLPVKWWASYGLTHSLRLDNSSLATVPVPPQLLLVKPDYTYPALRRALNLVAPSSLLPDCICVCT